MHFCLTTPQHFWFLSPAVSATFKCILCVGVAEILDISALPVELEVVVILYFVDDLFPQGFWRLQGPFMVVIYKTKQGSQRDNCPRKSKTCEKELQQVNFY